MSLTTEQRERKLKLLEAIAYRELDKTPADAEQSFTSLEISPRTQGANGQSWRPNTASGIADVPFGRYLGPFAGCIANYNDDDGNLRQGIGVQAGTAFVGPYTIKEDDWLVTGKTTLPLPPLTDGWLIIVWYADINQMTGAITSHGFSYCTTTCALYDSSEVWNGPTSDMTHSSWALIGAGRMVNFNVVKWHQFQYWDIYRPYCAQCATPPIPINPHYGVAVRTLVQCPWWEVPKP